MNTTDFLIHELSPNDQPLPAGHMPYSNDRPRKHGFVPELMLGEDERLGFYALEQSLYDEYRPTCATESLLLDEVTLNYWRLQRARTLESRTLGLEEDRENEKLLALYARYRTAFERSFYRALNLLRKVKAENTRLIARYRGLSSDRRELPPFVSQKPSRSPAPAERPEREDAA
jgi:hypothetical protein